VPHRAQWLAWPLADRPVLAHCGIRMRADSRALLVLGRPLTAGAAQTSQHSESFAASSWLPVSWVRPIDNAASSRPPTPHLNPSQARKNRSASSAPQSLDANRTISGPSLLAFSSTRSASCLVPVRYATDSSVGFSRCPGQESQPALATGTLAEILRSHVAMPTLRSDSATVHPMLLTMTEDLVADHAGNETGTSASPPQEHSRQRKLNSGIAALIGALIGGLLTGAATLLAGFAQAGTTQTNFIRTQAIAAYGQTEAVGIALGADGTRYCGGGASAPSGSITAALSENQVFTRDEGLVAIIGSNQATAALERMDVSFNAWIGLCRSARQNYQALARGGRFRLRSTSHSSPWPRARTSVGDRTFAACARCNSANRI
jgi:hypothetical protein